MSSFNEYIDTAEIDFIRAYFQREGRLCTFNKGSFFLRAGDCPPRMALVVSGYFKYSVIDSRGEECITGFALCNNLVGDYYGCLHHVPALNHIKAVTNSTCLVVSARKVSDMLAAHADVRIKFGETLFRMAHKRYLSLCCQTPKERYTELLKRCPDLLQHITLKEFASFLQITPTHLSRIRKEILQGK